MEVTKEQLDQLLTAVETRVTSAVTAATDPLTEKIEGLEKANADLHLKLFGGEGLPEGEVALVDQVKTLQEEGDQVARRALNKAFDDIEDVAASTARRQSLSDADDDLSDEERERKLKEKRPSNPAFVEALRGRRTVLT